MKAKVIDITEHLIYLQIGDQLRFRAQFDTIGSHVPPHLTDTVDFDFQSSTIPAVVIKSISSPDTPVRSIG